MAIHLAHMRNRHVTSTETALTTVSNHNRHIHPKTEKPIARVWFASSDIPPQTITGPPQTYPSQERKRRRSVPHDVGIQDVDRPDEKE
jgi:hypothetical protein